MVALWNTADHYIFALSFVLSSFFFPHVISNWMSAIFPHMVWPYCEFRMQVWNVLHVARWNTGRKNRQLCTNAQLCRVISSQLRHVSTIGKKLVKQQYLLQLSPQYGKLRALAAEIGPVVWGTPANFNGFRILAALLHGTLVVGVSQTLRHWTEDATYIRQGDHQVGHWPTF